jgi:hypothetical protein
MANYEIVSDEAFQVILYRQHVLQKKMEAD